MRDATPDFIAYLQSTNEFAIADLYTFTLKNGTIIRLTSWDVDVTVPGVGLFSAAGPYVSRSRIKQSVGLDVDEVNITINADITHEILGMPFMHALSGGWFRGAALQVHRYYMAELKSGKYVTKPLGSAFAPLLWFSGQVSTVECDRLQAGIVAVSDLYVLDVKLPRNVMQPACRHQLYELGCNVDRTLFEHDSAAQASSDVLHIVTTSAGDFATDGYFDQGVCEMTSGANAGLKRTIKKHADGKLYFHVPFPFEVDAGDTFTALPGCDKTLTKCGTFFSNRLNFGGEPFIPPPETVF